MERFPVNFQPNFPWKELNLPNRRFSIGILEMEINWDDLVIRGKPASSGPNFVNSWFILVYSHKFLGKFPTTNFATLILNRGHMLV